MITKRFFLLWLCMVLGVGGCQSVEKRITLADSIATEHGMKKETLPASHFTLTTYSVIKDPNQTLHIYIEGDGFSWVNRNTLSPNPTPKNPLTLKMASQDPHPNVLYIARPCQYSFDSSCRPDYWSGYRFAPEVIDSMNEAISHYVNQHHFSGIELIGYSGGGNIAALIAATRTDVVSLRTVAGNLNHVLLHKHHNVTQLNNSLNAADIAPQLKNLPQIHFSGARDTTVPTLIAHDFVAKLRSSSCATISVQPLDHYSGWDTVWPKLVREEPRCHD